MTCSFSTIASLIDNCKLRLHVSELPIPDRLWMMDQLVVIHLGTPEQRALAALGDASATPRYDNMDKVRFADESDPIAIEDFKWIRRHGCCGEAHFRLGPSPSGRFYLYGFNYGH